MRYFQRSRSFRKSTKHKELPIFGVPLAVAVDRNRCHDGVEIPLVVRHCIDHIQQVGLTAEGLYKESGKSKAQGLRRLYNQREPVSLADYDLPVATSLLKIFLRELPEPVLTAELLPRFEEAAGVKDVAVRGAELKQLVELLPPPHRQTLAWLVTHFHAVTTHEKVNKLNTQGIAAAMSPSLQVSQRLLSALVVHCDTLFADCRLHKYVPPLSCGSPSLPDTKDAIADELCKQESLLGQLHAEIQAGLCTRHREEQLWEVQRIITQLKRKLRGLERAAECTQRSLDEPDSSSRGEEEAPVSVATVTGGAGGDRDRPDLIAASADSLEIQAAEKSWLAKKEDLALTIETEELTNLAKTLQALIENEKAEVEQLRAKIRALGAVPTRSAYILDYPLDENSSEGLVNACKETTELQDQKQSLATSLIEERLAVVDLKVKLRLAQAAKG